MGQDEVQAEKAKVAAAAKAVETSKADVVSKEGAKQAACTANVNLGTISLAALEVRSCFDYSNVADYTTIKAACTSATSALAAANQAVAIAKTKATGADTALAGAVKEASRLMSGCLCSAHKAQKAAWAAVSTATDSHAADWKQAHEVICALDKTATCNVPTCPTVTQPTLAAGVANANSEHCTQSPTQAPTHPPCNCRCRNAIAATGVAAEQTVCYADNQVAAAYQGRATNWFQPNQCGGGREHCLGLTNGYGQMCTC